MAACVLAENGSDVSTANVVAEVDATPPPPRRVCPSEGSFDGGWVTVDGIDISDWQHTNWDEVGAHNPHLKFAFARISAGMGRVDRRFAHDWAAMKRLGLVRGAYQYFKPNHDAVKQADRVLQRLAEEGGLEPGDFPPVLDFEEAADMPHDTVVCRLKIWLSRVEQKTGRVPIIYTSRNWNAYLDASFARYPLWVPNYVDPALKCPTMPAAWPKWHFWQYTSSGQVLGVYTNGARDDWDGGTPALHTEDGGDGGPVHAHTDLDFFDGTLDDLKAFVSSTVSPGGIVDPPPLANPPHVPTPDGGTPIDCEDGCCVADP
jgi:GH25 family lysozyme M1 (1,4-beta-N-acetylmuramidase)